MVVKPIIGTSGRNSRIADRTAARSAPDGPRVRTANLSPGVSAVACANGRYIVGLYGGGFDVVTLPFIGPTTPTMTIHGNRDEGGPNLTRRPTGFSCGKSRSAVGSSRIATSGASGPSWSINSRPRITGTELTRKYAGEAS